jgi:hypothetical protein
VASERRLNDCVHDIAGAVRLMAYANVPVFVDTRALVRGQQIGIAESFLRVPRTHSLRNLAGGSTPIDSRGPQRNMTDSGST